MRTLAITTFLLLLFAGCIAPDATREQDKTPAAPAPADRIDGMTADVQKTDKVVDCNSGGSGNAQSCAERTLVVTGRIGLDRLPVDLVGRNGQIKLTTSVGDAWSFQAVVRVSAPTQDMADKGLDTAWSWSHNEGATHALRAGPTTAAVANVTPLPIPLPSTNPGGAQVTSARYEVTLPAWVTLAKVRLVSDNGRVDIKGFHTDGLDVESNNGAIDAEGWATDATLKTDNGQIVAALAPTATGSYHMTTSNGQIVAGFSGAAGGLDVDGKTTNGIVTFQLANGALTQNERTHKHFRSDGFDQASIKTTVTLDTSNGAITATG